MALDRLDITVRIVLPWWMPVYVWLLVAFVRSGLVPARPDIAAEFVVRHSRLEIVR